MKNNYMCYYFEIDLQYRIVIVYQRFFSSLSIKIQDNHKV